MGSHIATTIEAHVETKFIDKTVHQDDTYLFPLLMLSPQPLWTYSLGL